MVFESLTVDRHNRADSRNAMQLACPSCHTAFLVDPVDLGSEGRTVRCTRCRTSWFARPDDVVSLPSVVEAELEMTAESAARAVTAEASALAVLPKVVPWNDTVMVEVNPSPSIAPEEAQAETNTIGGPMPLFAPPRRAAKLRRAKENGTPRQRRIFIAVSLASIAFITAIGLRATVVRAAPELAGLYAAIGLPVNLRGLEFTEIKTMHEIQDGIPVLVIEGEVMNVTRQPVEVPRLRLAVLGPDARELYAWTALLPRSVLPEGEKLSFRSRLASPPAEGKQVLVRFLTRFDLTASAR
jgi:predicted Zn finger-like uncharacterized protein